MKSLHNKIKDMFYLSPINLFKLSENDRQQTQALNEDKILVSITRNQQPIFIEEFFLFGVLMIFLIFVGVFISFYTPLWIIAKNLK